MDIFKNDIFGKLEPPHGNVTIQTGIALPTDKDMYFVSKWNELFERYSVARLFFEKNAGDGVGLLVCAIKRRGFSKGGGSVYQGKLI